MIVANRRSFLSGLVSACAAPAIVTSSGFRSGLWLPNVDERWIAYYDGSIDTWSVRVDFRNNWPDSLRPMPFGNVPDHVRRLLDRGKWAEAILEAKRRAQLSRGPSIFGTDFHLTGDAFRFVSLQSDSRIPMVAAGNVDRLSQVAPRVRGGT